MIEGGASIIDIGGRVNYVQEPKRCKRNKKNGRRIKSIVTRFKNKFSKNNTFILRYEKILCDEQMVLILV